MQSPQTERPRPSRGRLGRTVQWCPLAPGAAHRSRAAWRAGSLPFPFDSGRFQSFAVASIRFLSHGLIVLKYWALIVDLSGLLYLYLRFLQHDISDQRQKKTRVVK